MVFQMCLIPDVPSEAHFPVRAGCSQDSLDSSPTDAVGEAQALSRAGCTGPQTDVKVRDLRLCGEKMPTGVAKAGTLLT